MLPFTCSLKMGVDEQNVGLPLMSSTLMWSIAMKSTLTWWRSTPTSSICHEMQLYLSEAVPPGGHMSRKGKLKVCCTREENVENISTL